MVYTVTLNPALDYVAETNRFEIGATNRTVKDAVRVGGKGINVSVVLHRLAVPTRAIAFIGGYVGNAVREMTEKCGIDARFIPCEGCTRINVKLKVRQSVSPLSEQATSEFSPSETELNGVGVIAGGKEIALLRKELNALNRGDWLVLSGSVPRGVPADIYAVLARDASARGARVVVDATGELLKNALNARPFLVKPNLQELGELFETVIRGESSAQNYAERLLAMGAENVVVSMGASGAFLLTHDQNLYRVLPPQGKIIDTVGAGDSLVAGFIAEYENTRSYRNALTFGVAAGSATAFSEWLAEKSLVERVYSELIARVM